MLEFSNLIGSTLERYAERGCYATYLNPDFESGHNLGHCFDVATLSCDWMDWGSDPTGFVLQLTGILEFKQEIGDLPGPCPRPAHQSRTSGPSTTQLDSRVVHSHTAERRL